jgi:tetratricopeptide (TPR) repeat protein
MMGNEALDHGDLERARTFAESAEAKASSDAPVFLLWGRIRVAEGQRALAKTLFEQALKKLEAEEGGKAGGAALAFMKAYRLYARPGSTPEEALFADPRAMDVLCEVGLRGKGAKADVSVLNECAWLLVTTDDETVRNPKRGLELAKKAVASLKIGGKEEGSGEMPMMEAAVRHTLATAHFANGNAQEARAILERILATAEFSEPSDRRLFEDDLKRFAYAAAKTEKPKPPENIDKNQAAEDDSGPRRRFDAGG